MQTDKEDPYLLVLERHGKTHTRSSGPRQGRFHVYTAGLSDGTREVFGSAASGMRQGEGGR
jgi:hypothetical protein